MPMLVRLLAVGRVALAVLAMPVALSAQPPPASTPSSLESGQPDIYYVWRDGGRLATGENPYDSILTGNMRQNRKYPTYFPLLYLLVAGAHRLGVVEFHDWLRLWRPLVMLSHLGIGILLLVGCWRSGHPVLGIFAALFWGLNRWTLYVVKVAHVDFSAILFLIASLLLFDSMRRTSFVLFGLSLAFKQIAVFIAPLYLIWVWRDAQESGKQIWVTAGSAAWMALVPTLVSLPFFVWNAEAFVRSVLFSATRDPDSHVPAFSIDAKLGLVGPVGRLPMVLIMSLAYVATIRGEIGRYLGVLLILATFVDFNTVFYLQYMAWLVPFIVLAALDRRPWVNG
jgi:uncharacterized membrane protein